MSLRNKKVLLTGASSALGQIIANSLVSRGAQVTSLDRSGGCGQVTNIRGDLSTEAGIRAAVDEIRSTDWDILINLAGMQYFGPIEDQAADHTIASYMVNLVAPVRLIQGVLPRMKARKSGQIVNIGSIFASIPFAHFAAYSSAKAGLKGFSEALRREMRDFNLTVTYVAPRAVDSPANSPQIQEFAQLTGMKMDSLEQVAGQIMKAIEQRKKTVYLGMPESLFVRINALFPSLVDSATASNSRTARDIFTNTPANQAAIGDTL